MAISTVLFDSFDSVIALPVSSETRSFVASIGLVLNVNEWLALEPEYKEMAVDA